MGLLRRLPSRNGASSPCAPADPGMMKVYPVIYAYLTDDTFEDGEARERSTMLLVAEGDLFKACMIDKNADATLWASGATFDDLFACLETRLSDPGSDWRRRKPPGPPSRKKG